MRLSHNLASLNVYKTYSKVLGKQSSAMEKITSGYKVNTAKDDPNVIAQSERMRMQIRGLQMASRNAQDGVSMLQSAEGGLEGMTAMLQRIRELTVQGGNGANTDADREVIQKEINQMIEGVDKLAKSTEFNGVKLLSQDSEAAKDSKGNYLPLQMPIGANPGESIDIPVNNLTSDELGKSSSTDTDNLKSIDITKISTDKALEIVDNAISTITSVRSKFGAIENRFESSIENLGEISDTTESADSGLRDADVAKEMAELAKNNLLVEAGNAMIVQTNKFPQDVLRILENVRSR